MNIDLSNQLDRVEELVVDLENEFNKILLSKEVSGRAKNITHEIIEKLSNILDQVARKLWDNYISSGLTDQEKKKTRIYFPIAKDQSSFDSILGRSVRGFKTKCPNLYSYYLSKQPFVSGNNWISVLRNIAGEKHIGLVAQKRTEATHITIASSAGTVHLISESVKFGPGVAILGAPIDPVTQRIIPTPGVEEKIEKWVSFVIEQYNVDALQFCKESYKNVKAIVTELGDQFKLP